MGIVVPLVGRSVALDLASSGRRLEASVAQSLGLVHRVVPVGQLSSEVHNWAEKLTELPEVALSETKLLLADRQSWSDEVATRAFLKCLEDEAAQNSIQRFQS